MAAGAAVAEEGAGEAAAAKPGLFALTGKKIMILGGVGVLLLAVGGAWFMGFIGGGATEEAVEGQEAAVPHKEAYFLDLPPVTVNLNSTERRAAYLRLNIALELADSSLVAEIEPFLPRIMDAFQVYLREVRMSDLEGSAGVYRLKEELRRRINLAVYPAKVDAVLFKEILIQ